MATPHDHRIWSAANADFARRLAGDEDSAARRWSVVVAYYAVMHALQAIAAESGQQRLHHDEVIEIPADFELPGHESLEMRTRELYNYCNKARYLRGSNAEADSWFLPYAQNATDLTSRAIDLMESVLGDL